MTNDIRQTAELMYYSLRARITVRALIWRSHHDNGDYEISQVEVLKLCDHLERTRSLRRYSFGVNIDLRRNTIENIEHSLWRSPQSKADGFDSVMMGHIETILDGWLKKEDLLLGRNENKDSNPWIEAGQKPFFGNIFQGEGFRMIVPASHPDMLPILTMCAYSMYEGLRGTCQGSPESELLAHFNSFVAQTRRESIRNTYGSR